MTADGQQKGGNAWEAEEPDNMVNQEPSVAKCIGCGETKPVYETINRWHFCSEECKRTTLQRIADVFDGPATYTEEMVETEPPFG